MTVEGEPAVSVILASHNRRELLRRCLESLCRQTQDPSTFEVIVAIDGSENGRAEMAEAFQAPFRLRVLRPGKAGALAALNAAIEAADGELCLFLDDGVVASKGLLAAHLRAHREEARTLGIGPLTQPPPAGGSWFAGAYAAEWNRRHERLAERPADWPDCHGGNFSAPRIALLRVGGFATEPAATRDVELGYRLCGAGCIPHYLPDAAGVRADEKTPHRILAERRAYGASCAELAEREAATRSPLLGWFLDTTPREVVLRRLSIALRVPPSALTSLGHLIPGSGRKRTWFGFVFRYAFWLGARSAMGGRRWRQTTRGTPVLMYHAFTATGERDRYILARRAFSRQLWLLRALRYRPLDLSELAGALREGQPLPPRSVVLTIDDGYRDNLEIAQPLLERHRFSATLFLVSRRLGATNDWSTTSITAGRPLLTLEQAKRSRDGGTEVGAHTRTHPWLTEVSDNAVVEEVGGSRRDLEVAFEAPIATFAYPFGGFDSRAVDAAAAAGFSGACTTEGRLVRLGDDPMLIPRIEVRGDDSLLRFLRKLRFAGA